MAVSIPKYKGYKDPITKIILCKDIDDLEPYHIVLPDPPKLDDMVNFGMDFKDQFFQPIKTPREIWELERLIKNEKDKSEAYKVVEASEELSNFVSHTHDLLEQGQWQLIRGVPTYIPPNYLKYLSFNKIPDKLPSFRDWDLHKFYWWNICVMGDPVVFGGIEMTRRQVGKSYIGGFLCNEAACSTESGIVGLQSKTEKDAQGEFRRTIVGPRKYYPFFLRPNSSTELTTKGDTIEYDCRDHNGEFSLDSAVSYKSSGALAYDGTKLIHYYNAECGKNVEEDINDIVSVIRPLLREDNMVRGKCLFSSTVEELSRRGGQNFKYLWIDSDKQLHNDKEKRRIDENGKTVSGLIPYFTPATHNYLADQYGNAIVNEPLDYQYEYLLGIYKRAKLKNPEKEARKGASELIDELINGQKTEEKKQAEIRKYPRNIKEAFRSSAVGCFYDITKINNRLDEFMRGNDHLVQKGTLDWKNGIKFGEVEFTPHADKNNQRFEISLLPQKYANQYTEIFGGRSPSCKHLFAAGADTFKYDKVKDVSRSSMGSGFVYAGFNPEIDNPTEDPSKWRTNDFVCQYHFRYENMPTDEYCEDMLKMCIFYSCQMAPEHNLNLVQKYFVDNGFQNYLMFTDKIILKHGVAKTETSIHAGFYTGEESKTPMINSMVKYVSESSIRCKFPRLLEQLRDMDYDFQPWDLFVAAACAYRHYHQVFEKSQHKKEIPKVNMKDFYRIM